METPTIYTLTLMVRSFSNEVTASWLAARLNISYSTLMRCKNGVWPRSVTYDSMRTVFEECRDNLFDGDGEALVESALDYLARQGIDSRSFRIIYEIEGFDSFVSNLIISAHESEWQAEPRIGYSEVALFEEPAEAQPTSTQSTSTQLTLPILPTQGKLPRKATMLSVAAMLLVGFFTYGFASQKSHSA